jgi:hypothetical protein
MCCVPGLQCMGYSGVLTSTLPMEGVDKAEEAAYM